MLDKNAEVFLSLTRAGLWEKKVQLSPYGDIDYKEVFQIAEVQTVVGLVAAGFEHVIDVRVPQEIVLQFVGQTLQLEQRNKAMNCFIGKLLVLLREAGIYTLLVKGQGIAQCYERPLWRTSGDIDLLVDKDYYQKAVHSLLPMSTYSKPEGRYSKHFGLTVDPWYIEVHGSMRSSLSRRVDEMIDRIQSDTFYKDNVRTWRNGDTDVFLPAPDNDVFFVFTHILQHLYKEGIVLRQICDLCRLLWAYRESLNYGLLVSRIRKAGLLAEWKAFAALAVAHLGMPAEAMPMYDSRFRDKGTRVLEFILKRKPYSKVRDTWAIAKIFPWNTLKFSPSIFFNVNGLKIKERIFG